MDELSEDASRYARSEFASLFSGRSDSPALDEMDDIRAENFRPLSAMEVPEDGSHHARSEFASLFSAPSDSPAQEEREDIFAEPYLSRRPEEDEEESVPGDDISLESGEATVTSLSLTEFVVSAKQLAENDEAVDDFCKFVLTGVREGRQFQIDPIKHAMSQYDSVQASRDYDSVLGFGKHIFLDCDLTIHPICKLEDTLRKNIHIKRSFTNAYGRHDDIPVHHIPNLCIAKWGGTHNMLRAVIPGLYHQQRTSSLLEQSEFAVFYEKGFRPAVQSLSPASVAEWPPTYQAELFRARGKRGTMALQTKTLGKWFVRELGDAIRTSLRNHNVPWGKGIIFMYQIKGVKASNSHRTSADSARLSLDELFVKNNITEEGIDRGDWWVDVGLEISSRGEECLAWRTDHHFHIVKHVLSIDTPNAQRITKPGSSKYIRDLTSHLTAVAGCRISPGERAQGPYEAIYLQMYTTDKSVIYRPEGAHFGKHLTGKEILENKADAYCRGLYDLYTAASIKNNGHARVEVRVPYEHAASVLVDIEFVRELFVTSLIRVSSVVWWSLRAYRIYAFIHILEQQSRGSGSQRHKTSALLLTAAAPWFLNGLHSTPDNGPCSRDLMSKILPLVNRELADADTLVYPLSTRTRPLVMEEEEAADEDNEDADNVENLEEDNISVLSIDSGALPANPTTVGSSGSSEVPYAPYGMIFLRDIRMGNDIVVPRFRDNTVPMVSDKTLQFIFGRSPEAIADTLFKNRFSITRNPLRTANKTRRTAARVPQEIEPLKLFNVASRGVALAPPLRDSGSDAESDESEENDLSEMDIDTRLTTLWFQFLADITAKVPNRKAATEASYCVLTPEQRQAVNDDTYRNLRLSEYFSNCQYRQATRDEWAAAFDKFWPVTPFVMKTSQNFGSMTYYASWGTLVAQLSNMDQATDMLQSIRSELRARFRRLFWIPNVQADRIWYTKPDPKHFKRLHQGNESRATAPRILIRWNKQAIV